ncbi:hypothetical protein AK812_SmicGene42402, partial [Symbiodinium microadriaticum]
MFPQSLNTCAAVTVITLVARSIDLGASVCSHARFGSLVGAGHDWSSPADATNR